MIELGPYAFDLSDPLHVTAAIGAALVLLLCVFAWAALRRAARAATATHHLLSHLSGLGHRVQALAEGQQQMFGGLHAVSETQAQHQAHTLNLVEQRLADMSRHMTETLHGSASRTAQSLGALHHRLQVIDQAQANIEKLSGDVLSLQDILSNKQTRGAFGEIQLHDLVRAVLPRDSYRWQATLSNGKRADCVILLPGPPGPIAIDAKFPLEAFEMLRGAETAAERDLAGRQFRQDMRAHIHAIAGKYIIEGETADGALMFLPSEAVYAELHSTFSDLVRESFAARVWIVSPTTLMATLNTVRAILKDARMRDQAGAIRKELAALTQDLDRLSDRVDQLDRHFGQAAKDVDLIKNSAEKAAQRARRLDHLDFDSTPKDQSGDVISLRAPDPH